MKIILASASPRRSELLKQLGLPFTVQKSGVTEKIDDEEKLPAGEIARLLALRKARAVASHLKEGLVIAADTTVVCAGRNLAKPTSFAEAEGMLETLSGKSHSVFTGVALCDAAGGKEISSVEETSVWMRTLTREEIHAYVSSGEAYDKAGGYGIQGRAGAFVRRIEGCYFNVVGLPLSKLVLLLREFNLETCLFWYNKIEE